jgi:hypothetical protein
MPVSLRVLRSPGIALAPRILRSPRRLIPIGSLILPMMLIGEELHVCRRCRRQGRAPEQVGQQQADVDDRHDTGDRVAEGPPGLGLRAA